MMDGNSRIMHRIRPRPYDLRRKVLLKNFLREQMTYIPPVRILSDTAVEVSSNADVSPEESISIGNEENIETYNDHPQPTQSNVLPSEPIPGSSAPVVNEILPSSEASLSNAPIANIPSESDNIIESKFSRLSMLLRLKSASKKRRKRGISKAKHTLKSINNPITLTPQIPDKRKVDSKIPVLRKKSFFELFKFRRAARKEIQSKTDAQCSSVSQSIKSNTTTDQSIQTDISLFNETYNELEETNKCLQEENRLLSESLSYIMSDINFKLNSKRKSCEFTDSYSNTTISDFKVSPNNGGLNMNESNTFDSAKQIPSKPKLLRSKSVQGKCSIPKIRTRSNVFPEPSKIFNASSKLSGFRSPNSYRLRSYATSRNLNRSAPESNHQSVLKSLPINSSKTIIRRSSMPERTYREPIRQLLRPRPDSVHVINYSSDVHKKPNHNASYSHSDRIFSRKQSSIRKSIIRRSSMPERTSRNNYQSVHRHHSINSSDFSNKSCRRPNSTEVVVRVDEYSRSVSFQNMPNEAFY